MATVQYYMNYTIFFSDIAEYNFALSVSNSSLLEMTPRDAAAMFGIPYPYPSGDMSTIPKGIYFIFPFTPGTQFQFPGPTGQFVDDTVLTTVVAGQAGVPASIWPAGPDGLFTWSGNIILSQGAGAGNNPPANAIAQRRWIAGREISNFGEGGANIVAGNQLRDSSRTIDGFGWAIRGASASNSYSRTLTDLRAGLVTNTSWERFYVRVRRMPTTLDTGIWRCHGLTSAAGFGIKLGTAGDLHGYNINGAATENDEGTIFSPTINQWFRVDIFVKYQAFGGINTGRIVIYINGVFVYTFTDSAGFGLNSTTRHISSELGDWTAGNDDEIEVDMDDWINADLPANVDPDTLGFIDANFSLDWLLGSHIRVHSAISATQVGWTPAGEAVGAANQYTSGESRLGTSQVTSTTSGATLEVLTDALNQATPDSIANVLGAAAAIISYRNINTSGTDGQLGYRKAGAAAVMTAINQLTTEATQFATYNILAHAAAIIPEELYPWSLTHTKSADGFTDNAFALSTIVEYLGVWGPEDDPNFQYPISRLTNLHNCRYPNTVYGYAGSQPDAPVFAVGGTYLGNGSYQEIILPGPCHFLLIRAQSSGGGGIKTFGAGAAGNFGADSKVVSNVRMWFDFINQAFKFSVTGALAATECNANGTTYQYIAFCDPGMRYNLTGMFAHGSSSSTPKTNNLIASDFISLAGFVQQQVISTAVSAVGLWFRGPGNPNVSDASSLNGGAVEANAFNFGTGILNSYSAMHSAGSGGIGYAYSLWRTQDSGVTGCLGNVMVQILTYTGDGSSPRDIPLTPTSGRFPLFVMVSPVANAATLFRDPTHAGTNSMDIDTLSVNAATGIIACAMDQITVGSALNTNNVVYNVFVICGDVAGMNNGIFYPTYCEGSVGPYVPPAPVQGNIIVMGNGGLSLNGLAPTTMLKDISGIYTLVTGKRTDTLINRQTGQPNVEVEIPDPTFKTGYVGG